MNTHVKTRNYIVDIEYFEKHNSYSAKTYIHRGVELVAYTSDVQLNHDGIESGSDLPLDQYLNYLRRNNHRLYKVWSPDQFNIKLQEQNEIRKCEEGVISPNVYRWRYKLLPPCRETVLDDLELFHESEKVCGNLVKWNALFGDMAYEVVDEADADIEVILTRFRTIHQHYVSRQVSPYQS